MTKATLPTTGQTEKIEPKRPSPEPLAENPDILDWDVAIETPPVRPSGTLRVILEYAGRGRPKPVSEPMSDD